MFEEQIEKWLTRSTPKQERSFDLNEFPNHSFCICKCANCGVTLKGLFEEPNKIRTCPECDMETVETIRVLRKIWLQ